MQAQILDTKEFLAPIIMPHEAVLAFSPDTEYSAAWPEHFSAVLQGGLHCIPFLQQQRCSSVCLPAEQTAA